MGDILAHAYDTNANEILALHWDENQKQFLLKTEEPKSALSNIRKLGPATAAQIELLNSEYLWVNWDEEKLRAVGLCPPNKQIKLQFLGEAQGCPRFQILDNGNLVGFELPSADEAIEAFAEYNLASHNRIIDGGSAEKRKSKVFLWFSSGYWRAAGEGFPYYCFESHSERDRIEARFLRAYPEWCQRHAPLEFEEIPAPDFDHVWHYRQFALGYTYSTIRAPEQPTWKQNSFGMPH